MEVQIGRPGRDPNGKNRGQDQQRWLGKFIKAPETGRTDTIFARHRMTAGTMIPAQAKAMTPPAEHDIAIISPELTKRPMPIVSENAMAIYLIYGKLYTTIFG
jgi:hypothetical protein